MLWNMVCKYYFVAIPVVGLASALLVSPAMGQTVGPPMPTSQEIGLLNTVSLPAALVLSSFAISWVLSKIVDTLKAGGIPIAVEVGFDQRSRNLLRELAGKKQDEDDEDN